MTRRDAVAIMTALAACLPTRVARAAAWNEVLQCLRSEVYLRAILSESSVFAWSLRRGQIWS